MTMKSITAYGVTFDVDYTGTEGRAGTHWEPPEPAELDIENVYIAGQNVTELLQECVLEAIYEALDSGLDDDRQQELEDAAEAHAEYLRDYRSAA